MTRANGHRGEPTYLARIERFARSCGRSTKPVVGRSMRLLKPPFYIILRTVEAVLNEYRYSDTEDLLSYESRKDSYRYRRSHR